MLNLILFTLAHASELPRALSLPRVYQGRDPRNHECVVAVQQTRAGLSFEIITPGVGQHRTGDIQPTDLDAQIERDAATYRQMDPHFDPSSTSVLLEREGLALGWVKGRLTSVTLEGDRDQALSCWPMHAF